MTCNILDSVSSMKQMHGQESSLKSDDRGIRNNGLIINIWTYEQFYDPQRLPGCSPEELANLQSQEWCVGALLTP